MRLFKRKPNGVNNILDRLPELTREGNAPHEKVVFQEARTPDKLIKVIEGQKKEIQPRPDRELLIFDISGKERIVNNKDVRGMDAIEDRDNVYRYFIRVLEESIEISWPEFKRLTFYANGDRYLLNK